MLHAARWKYRTQKNRQSSSRHHCTNLSGSIFATKAYIDNRKKNVKEQYLLHMSPQHGELRPSNGWDLLASLGRPSKFRPVSRLDFLYCTNGGQQNFAGCLAISWAGTLYIQFWGLLPPNGILTAASRLASKSCVSLYKHRSVTARHSSSGRQPTFVAWYNLQGMELRNFHRGQGATNMRLGGHHVGYRPTF